MSNLTREELAEVAAYLSLWLAIHGGDPAPNQVVSRETAIAIAAHMTATLSRYAASLTEVPAGSSHLQQALTRHGLRPIDPQTERARLSPHQCVDTGHGVICYPGGKPQPVRF